MVKEQMEFNLSEKSQGVRVEENGETNYIFLSKDVKEFIRLLKEEPHYFSKEFDKKTIKHVLRRFVFRIDKIAGEKLI